MGGTDLQDQRASYYRFQHRTKRWPHRIYSHFIQTCAVNSFLLFKRHKSKPGLKYCDYLYSLIFQLTGFNTCPEPEEEIVSEIAPPDHHVRKYKTSWVSDTSRLAPNTHNPETNIPKRRRCVICDKKVGSKCATCDAALCCVPQNGVTCWYTFHNQVTL
jgi:hypothetical protein